MRAFSELVVRRGGLGLGLPATNTPHGQRAQVTKFSGSKQSVLPQFTLLAAVCLSDFVQSNNRQRDGRELDKLKPSMS
jgi:hypothetical protein